MTEEIKIINDIEKACEFCEREFTHEELFEILRGEDDVKKQICILKIKELKTPEEAQLLVFHLTEHHGIVRESTAQKLNEIILNGKYNKLFQNKYAMDSFLKGINDINPNICRTLIEAIPKLIEGSDYREYFFEKLYNRIEEVFEELERLKRSNRYTKKLFNLYWCLEMLAYGNAPFDNRLFSILKRTYKFRDYTIREKSAMILANHSKRESSPLEKEWEELKESLKDDPNFYVRHYVSKF